MTEEEIVRRAGEAIKRFDSLRIVGVGWSGDSRLGFQFNPSSGLAGAAGGITPPVQPSGACCPPSGHCFISTQAVCVAGGGTYQGDHTTCDPDPCPPSPTGACCVGSACTIETEDDCTGMGGVYQGDDTTCDPNPCEMQPCNGCGFGAFDFSGRTFLTKTVTWHIVKIQSCLNLDPTLTCERGTDATYIFTSHYENDCSLTSTVQLFGDATITGPFREEIYHNCNGSTIHDSAPICSPLTISATEQFCSSETDFNHPTCTPSSTSLVITSHVVLSDECIP